MGYPIVLKPIAGLGARNTQRAHDEVSLASALNALLPSADHPAQAEEFVTGEEHTFETVTIGGKTVWFSSTEYVPSPLKVLENQWMQYALILLREVAPPHVADPWAAWAQLMVHRTWSLPERRFGAGSVFLRAMGGAEVVRGVEGVEVIRQRLGPAFFDMKAPQVGQPRSSHYEGDGWVVVRHPETKGVVAAMRTVLEAVRVQ